MRLIDKSPAASQALESVELAFKKPVFGCQACGNCVLGMTEYVCPMTCPKNLRNGPCGGTFNGQSADWRPKAFPNACAAVAGFGGLT